MSNSFPDWRIHAATAATADDTDAKDVASAPQKRLYLIAWANGSGKSTIARVLLPTEGVRFVNPDDIARELNHDAPEHAKVAAGREPSRCTIFSRRGYERMGCKVAGYRQ